MSNHPPKMVRGIIFSLMRTYKRQNTKTKDYHDMAIKLFRRHVARGWTQREIKQHILDANTKLQLELQTKTPTTTTTVIQPTNESSTKDRIFLHMEYDKRDITRKSIRALYD